MPKTILITGATGKAPRAFASFAQYFGAAFGK